MMFGGFPGYPMPFEPDEKKPWYVRLAGYRHGIKPYATIPQALADAWTEIVVEACRGFHEEDYMLPPALDYIDDLTDEMVEKRIAGYQLGYDKEYNRRAVHGAWSDLSPSITGGYEKLRYVFADLPMPLQRSIVSNWNRVHYEWMAEHPLVHYEPAYGYFWLIERCVIKMYEPVDAGDQPTEESVISWENMGAPGGIYDSMAMASARSAGDMEPDYTAYGEFED